MDTASAFVVEEDIPVDLLNSGEIIDAELVEDVPVKRDEEKPDKPDKPKSGPPNLDEWLDFFSRIVLRSLCDWYVSFAFRGIDENVVSERDLNRLRMTKEERREVARPFAEFANKSKLARKHGRTVIAAADSFESIVTLGIWFSRVNRIAAKYRPKHRRNAPTTGEQHEHSRPPASNGNGQWNGSTGGFVPPENVVIHNPGTG